VSKTAPSCPSATDALAANAFVSGLNDASLRVTSAPACRNEIVGAVNRNCLASIYASISTLALRSVSFVPATLADEPVRQQGVTIGFCPVTTKYIVRTAFHVTAVHRSGAALGAGALFYCFAGHAPLEYAITNARFGDVVVVAPLGTAIAAQSGMGWLLGFVGLERFAMRGVHGHRPELPEMGALFGPNGRGVAAALYDVLTPGQSDYSPPVAKLRAAGVQND